jgi:cobalt-zinc-cadmium efflux system protein
LRLELPERSTGVSRVVSLQVAGSHEHSSHELGAHNHALSHFGLAFAIGFALNLAYVVAEAFWGLSAHSVALLADAAHNSGDVAGLGAAWFASILSRRGPAGRFTYGYRRSSILSSLANSLLLLVMTGAIAWEAIGRLMNPEATSGLTVLAVALAGILINGATAWLLMSGRRDLNVRTMFVHMAADAALAAGVAVAGGIIMITRWRWVDPAMSLIVSAVILATTWGLLKDSMSLSLDAVPAGVDLQQVDDYLRALPGVEEVHDLHVWGLSTTETALTAHIVRQQALPDHDLIDRIVRGVHEEFEIGHATVQLETPEMAQGCALRPDHVV